MDPKNSSINNDKNKTSKANVLVTAAGGIVAQGIIKSLKLADASNRSPIKYRIVATDASPQAAGLYRCDTGILIPPASSPNYIDSLINIAKDQNIQAIYVGSDEELVPIGKTKERIENETGAKVLTSSLEVLVTARDKWKTFEFLNENNLPCPASLLPEDEDDDKKERFIQEFGLPVIVKPREGYGSKHFYVVNNKDEMNYAISKIQEIGWNPILQEYLGKEGDNADDNNDDSDTTEFTSGVTIDKSGKYVMSSISIRKIIKGGQTYKAFIDNFESIRRSAEEVALKLRASGAINIQAKLQGNKPKIFEINPRFSATCPMRSAAGINEPDIVFRNAVLGEDIKVDIYQKLMCMRYWNEVYVQHSTYEKTLNTGKVENNDDDDTIDTKTTGDSFILNYF
jgi:carbamoyl-phosphate synthase large subunit